MTHGRGSEGETGEWSGQTVLFTLPRNMVYPALLPLMRTPRLPVIERTDAPADLNGLVRFADGRNLVSARVPSHFKRSLPPDAASKRPAECNAARHLYGFRKLKRALGEKYVILRAWTSFCCCYYSYVYRLLMGK